jgi:hypothetical protein
MAGLSTLRPQNLHVNWDIVRVPCCRIDPMEQTILGFAASSPIQRAQINGRMCIKTIDGPKLHPGGEKTSV